MSASTVLVVEDNEQNMDLVSFLLEEAGIVVRQARTAEAARREIAGGGLDLVLLDMSLGGGGGGLELLAEIRARRGALKVVAITAHAMRGDRERFLAAGCDGYISKPIDVKAFVGLVRSFLAPGGAGGGLGHEG